MRITTIIIALAVACLVFVAAIATAQDRSPLTGDAYVDSLAAARNIQKIEKKADAKTLSDLKDEKSDAKLQKKEAQRVETNASNSAKASKNAYKSEKKAQKARKHADADAKKAGQAKKKVE